MAALYTYLHKSHINKQGKCAVYVSFNLSGSTIRKNTGLHIDPKKFDEEKGIVKGNTKDAKEANLLISACKTKINDILVKYHLLKVPITLDMFEKEYKMYSKTEFFSLYTEYKMAERKKVIEAGTYRHHKSIIGKFNKMFPKLTLGEFSPSVIEQYIASCRKAKLKQSTIRNQTNILKHYLNEAIKDNLIQSNPFSGIKIAKGEARITYLTENELISLWNLYNNKTLSLGHYRVLEIFLFGCFTGLRFSDVISLSWNDVQFDSIVKNLIKTKNSSGVVVNIPLCEQAKVIINNRKEKDPYCTETVFQSITNQAANRALKEVLKMCELNYIEITFHTSRHTFATLYYKKNRNPIALMKLLGHKKIEETMKYTYIFQEDIKSSVLSTFDF